MKPHGDGTGFRVELHFDPGLAFFLPKHDRGTLLTKILREKTSVKDAIEACGVPHPEVDFIQSNGVTVPFEHQLQTDAIVHVYGVPASPATAEEQVQERRVTKFVVDGHLGKLARVSWASTSPTKQIRQMISSWRWPWLTIAHC